MRLYMTPGSCTTGIHILLEEIDDPFEAAVISLPAGDHLKPEYLAMNPKGTIPTLLRDDGTALTTFQSIAWWLARTKPRAKLLPADPDGEARVLEMMDHCVAVIHGQGFARIFTTEKYALTEEMMEPTKVRGREIVERGFALVEKTLEERAATGDEYVCGAFSIADAALFYVEFWADKIGIPLPPLCKAHYERMRTRRAVSQVLREEGYR